MQSFWIQLLIILLPFASLMGWLLARRKYKRQVSEDEMACKPAYFKGLNYLLNEQPDKAIDVFVRMIEVDSETVETHLALGNLFRRRGEVDRAIRIHQNLIARPTLTDDQRALALQELGGDYLKAGLYDRAEGLMQELLKTGSRKKPALKALLFIYQQEKDWLNAIDVSKQLLDMGDEKQAVLQAHFYCELADDFVRKEDYEEVVPYLKQALEADPDNIRAGIAAADILQMEDEFERARERYRQLLEQHPNYIGVFIKPLQKLFDLATAEGNESLYQFLLPFYEKRPDIQLGLILADCVNNKDGEEAAIAFLSNQLKRNPSMRGLHALLDLNLARSSGETRELLQGIYRHLDDIMSRRAHFRCKHCGYESRELNWQCPSCKSWSSLKPIYTLSKEEQSLI